MNFREELMALINKYSFENGSDTPDFILAEYIMDSMAAFNKGTNLRKDWHENPTSSLYKTTADKYYPKSINPNFDPSKDKASENS